MEHSWIALIHRYHQTKKKSNIGTNKFITRELNSHAFEVFPYLHMSAWMLDCIPIYLQHK